MLFGRHSKFKKVADHLYEVTYRKYDAGALDRYLGAHGQQGGIGAGCSSFLSGRWFGRNLDLVCSEACDVVVHTPRTEDRFATLAMCGGKLSWTPSFIEHEMDRATADVLPYAVMDGINQHGVCVSTLVVPYAEVGGRTTETNPGAEEELYLQFVPRFVLDHCRSARGAVDRLRSMNLTSRAGDFFGFDRHGYEPHFMVADQEDAFVVELVHGRLAVVPAHHVTNYYLSVPPTPHRNGVERLEVMEEQGPDVRSAKDAFAVLDAIRYSLTYDFTHDPFFWSEHCGNHPELGVDITNENVRDHADLVKAWCEAYDPTTRDPSTGFWKTWHSAVYDAEDLKLQVKIQEQRKVHKFKL